MGRPSITTNDDCWTDKELLHLVAAIQKYGFKDPGNMSNVIGTKNKRQVENYITKITTQMRKVRFVGGKKVRYISSINHLQDYDDLSNWPNIRKWLPVTYNQMFDFVRNQDLSLYLMKSLCEKFCAEAPEAPNAQVLDVKAIYRYMVHCMALEVPPELPPLESTFVLVMVRKMRDMVAAMDFAEELKFIQEFRKCTSFVPFKVKNEFRKKSKKEIVHEDICGRPLHLDKDSVPIPEDMYEGITRHRRICQSFNPLTVPMWLLVKEQEYLHQVTARGSRPA